MKRLAAFWETLEDADRTLFKQTWHTFGGFEFCTVKKSEKHVFNKGSKHLGEMISIYKIADELGGWQHKPCQAGAFRYAAMCLKIDKQSLSSDTHWSGLRMFRFIKHLSWEMSESEWRTEVQNFTTEQDNDWQVKADFRKAAICFASHHPGRKVLLRTIYIYIYIYRYYLFRPNINQHFARKHKAKYKLPRHPQMTTQNTPPVPICRMFGQCWYMFGLHLYTYIYIYI